MQDDTMGDLNNPVHPKGSRIEKEAGMAEFLAFIAFCVFVFFAMRLVRESGLPPSSFGSC